MVVLTVFLSENISCVMACSILLRATLWLLITGTSCGMSSFDELGNLVLLVVQVLEHLASSRLGTLSLFTKYKHLRATLDHLLDWSFVVLFVLFHHHLFTMNRLVWNTNIVSLGVDVGDNLATGAICLTLILLQLHLLLVH